MNVFILSADSHEDWTMLGIFTTREKAEAVKAEYETPYRCEWMEPDDPPMRPYANAIREVPLDQKLDLEDWPHPRLHALHLTPAPPAPLPESER